ncbi:hypothetical protein [Bosea sp. (in: a-proteobacteria)]|uniref:hypothetical protein n=1 Tax=Bosea sp. (in: a-proteobacteria) TaxID=1871050 RepID=UPI003B3BD84A
MDAAWAVVSGALPDDPALRERARLRLAYIVAGLLQAGQEEQDLAAKAVARFRDAAEPDSLA